MVFAVTLLNIAVSLPNWV